jgi:glycosyltransferase involved in cell wall biosynthesis
MKNRKFCIIVSDYSDENSKRQPWYTVKHLKEVVLKGYPVEILSSFDDITNTDHKCLTVIKFWSVKDLFYRPKLNGELVYLMSFPIYAASDLLRQPMKIWENRKDVWKIFLASLLPKFLILKALNKANCIIFISDKSFDYVGSKVNKSISYYPFFQGNWGGLVNDNSPKLVPSETNNLKVGYFGPPFSSRGIDDVINLINNLNKQVNNIEFKLIVRTEREELVRKLDKYVDSIKDKSNVSIVDGFLSRDRLFQELRDLDVIILPFSFVFSELPVVVLEAIELNKLVLTTKNSGLHRIAEEALCCSIIDLKSYSNSIEFEKSIRTMLDSINLTSTDQLLNKIEQVNSNLRDALCQN